MPDRRQTVETEDIWTVSVVIPVFGPQPLLLSSINSAFANEHVREIIVVDDGSDPPIDLPQLQHLRLLRTEENRGAGAARNFGAQNASCQWLAFLDSDDTWDEKKISTQLAALRSDTSGSVGVVCGFSMNRGRRRIYQIPPKGRLTFDEAVTGARFGLGSTLLLSRTAFLKTGGYNESYLRHEDWEWLLRLTKVSHLRTMDEVLVSVTLGKRPASIPVEIALDGLSLQMRSVTMNLHQRRKFRAAIALERASLRVVQRRYLAAVLEIFVSALNRPKWTSEALIRRLLFGDIPGG